MSINIQNSRNKLSLVFIGLGFISFFVGFITMLMTALDASLTVTSVCGSASPMVMGLMFVVFGIRISKDEKNDSNVNLLSSAVNVMGFVEILCSAVIGVGQCITEDFNTGFTTIMIGFFVGLFVVWFGIKVNDEPSPRDRFAWILIAIFTLLIMVYSAIVVLISSEMTLAGVVDFAGRLIIGLFVMLLLFDPEVKRRFFS